METIEQFFENKDYENLLYYFDYKIFLSDYNDIYMENSFYKSKSLNEKQITRLTMLDFSSVFKNILRET